MSSFGNPDEAVAFPVIGLAALTHGAYSGVDLQPIWEGLMARVRENAYDAGALMDMAIILQLTGQREQGLEAQRHAVALHQAYARPGRPGGLRLLAFVTPGDFMANTPIDFLLEGTTTSLIELYMVDGEPLPPVPEHDLAFVAIGESDDSHAVLENLAPMLEVWPRPVLNRKVKSIASLSRDGVSALFEGSQQVIAPRTVRVGRGDVERVAAGDAGVTLLENGLPWPWIIRPVGSHAGGQLEQIADAAALATYLLSVDAREFFVAPFIEYAGPDGLYRKYRIALIGGRPFISHLAISKNWMVHYLNAGMSTDAAKRDEEARVMAEFDTGFAARHAEGLAELCAKIELDYFGVDCAETADGKLLLFEADVAMIIHSMDEPELYPYKGPAMKKLFAGFNALLESAVKA